MTYKIPLFDLNFDDREQNAVLQVLRSRWISAGPKTEELEKMFAGMMNVRYAIAVSSCTAALHLAMRCLEIHEGDEVICPSLTFVATANAIRYVNAKPVFCDISSFEDLTIDPDMTEALVTDKTRAIMVMHYGGFPCNMDKILRVVQKHRLKLIEDACHGPLSEYKGQKLGTIGDIGCFSFFSNKNISTGEGGMLITNNEEYFKKAKLLRSHGMTSMSYDRSRGHSTAYDVVDLGYNYRIDDMRSAIGIVQLEKLQKDIEKRAYIRQLYVEKLSEIEGLIIPFNYRKEMCSHYLFPIVMRNSTIQKRDRLRDALHNAGIQTSVHYPAVHRFSIYANPQIKLERTEYAADNLITLPMHSSLSQEDIGYICLKVQEMI
jgi:dTDP-4-amino-4,6-dideoxygalactose transaminase